MRIKRIFDNIKTRLVHIYNDIRDYGYNRTQRARLKNTNFSIISSNCLGGILYHRYKMQFLSPTINLWIEPKDFIPFCENIRDYLEKGKLRFVESKKDYPVGLVECDGLPSVKVYFMHYLTKDDALLKWEQRAKRFNYDNYYIISSDFGLQKNDALRLAKVKSKNTVIFTAGEWGELPKCYTLEKYIGQRDVGKYVNDIDNRTGVRYVEEVFDFASFFNS